jgi:hypothetical protein
MWTTARWSASDLASSSGRTDFWADYDANEIWVADDPTDRVVELARAPAAIAGDAKGRRGPRVRDREVRQPRAARRHHPEGAGWTIERWPDWRRSARRRQPDRPHNMAGFSPLWEAGGTRFARTDGLLRDNHIHHNMGPGLWTDINNIRTTIERNITHGNTGHGIFHEISYRAVLRDNRETDNGGAEPLPGLGRGLIRVAASPDVDIYGNYLAGNENAVMLVQRRRSGWPSLHGAHLLSNIEVHDNQVTLASHGLTGQVDDTESRAFYTRDIRFRDNTYRLPSLDTKVFAWQGAAWAKATWKQRFGQDASSTFTTDWPKA